MTEWKSSACILCECNCGIEVQLGGDNNREIVRTRGDKAHPASAGYLCQKASGLNRYQNGKDRITSPLKKNLAGGFDEVSWDQAISEIAARLAHVRDTWGGKSILYYGGGGQGNHLPGGYATGLRRALGIEFRSNALAQEKTGEFWVNGQMFGAPVRGDFEHCDVALFIGKNPWQSHGIPRARAWLRDFSKDPSKTMIVIDPIRTETAQLADIHLQVRPGTDAWLLAALIGALIQRDLVDESWVDAHCDGFADIAAAFGTLPVDDYRAVTGVSAEDFDRALAAIVGADGLAVFEDLGIQMGRNSTLSSYLEKLIWVLRGQFARPGAQFITPMLVNVTGSGRISRSTPVTGAPIISGLVPCNVIPDEILTDHPDRFRAMFIETANPVHSLADSARFAEALESLDTVVVVDIAMTETARHADYVLPASTQYEKWEATFFNFEFPDNHFHLRKPLFEPLPNTLSEAEIHARLLQALGEVPEQLISDMNAALSDGGPAALMQTLMSAMKADPRMADYAPVLLYLTLGKALPGGAAEAAALLPIALRFAMGNSEALAAAGFEGAAPEQARQLFEAMLSRHSGFVFASSSYDSSWQRLGHNGRIQLALPEMLSRLTSLTDQRPSLTNGEFPLVLQAGERRDYSANTIFRDAGWRRKDPDGSLRVNAEDAEQLGLNDGDQALLSTRRGSATVRVEVSDRMQRGHISLPNGFGLDNRDGQRVGVAPNELTSLDNCDDFAYTPLHKHVLARLEPLQASG